MKRWMGCMVILLVLILPGFGQAEDEKKNEPPEATMQEVVVTATRQEEKISSVPANTTVLHPDPHGCAVSRNYSPHDIIGQTVCCGK